MAQIFKPSTNTLARVSIFGAVFFLAAGALAWDRVLRSPYATRVDVPIEQPVPFSHKHHVQGLGLDCRYCHTSVEEAAYAGIPSTKVCMTCHSLVWTDTPMLEPVRESWRTDESLPWTKVHDLPDFAYFDHSVHVAKGIGCSSCHGAVDEMPLVWQENTLHMEWCLDCHRAPEKHVRPLDRIFDMDFEPQVELTLEERLELVHDHRIQSLTNCSVCHR